MRIDAHHHLWRIGHNGFEWPTPDLTAIYRDYAASDLKAVTQAIGIDRTVLVQSQPDARDTAWMLLVAAREPTIAAVVGWTDLSAPDAPAAVEALARHPKLRSLRPMLQNLERDDWIADPLLDPAIAAMKAHGLRFDALVMPRHLKALLTFARRHPDLPIVIDHGAKPFIQDRILDGWDQDMRALAALPNLFCKLSGLLTEARPDDGAEALRPYVDRLLDFFGPDRLMWGSDWPVLELAAPYDRWLAMCETLLADCDPMARAAVFGETAARFYGIAG